MIALIITIIVLLILAMVVINEIKGDGIIDNVKDAVDKYKKGEEKEELALLQNEWAINKHLYKDKTFKSFMEDKLKDKAISVEGQDDGPLTITMESGNQYTVEENGKIELLTKEDTASLEELKRYILGADGQGRALTDIMSEEGAFVQDSSDSTSTTHEKVKFLTAEQVDETTYRMYIRYNGEDYSFEVTITEDELITIKDSLVLAKDFDSDMFEFVNYILGPGAILETNEEGVIGAIPPDLASREIDDIFDRDTYTFKQDPLDPTSTIHEKVKLAYWYGGIPYIRFNGNVYTLAATSEGNLGMLLVKETEGNIGKYVRYKGINWIVLREDNEKVELISADVLGEVKFEAANFDEARQNYNNIATILTEECIRVTGITSNIRNVGGLAQDEQLTESNTVDFNELLNVSDNNIFSDYEGISKGFRKPNESYLTDIEQMQSIGIFIADNAKDCWLSAGGVSAAGLAKAFGPLYIKATDRITTSRQDSVAKVFRDGTSDYNETTNSYGVRPIITLESTVLQGVTQTGLIDDPIILD